MSEDPILQNILSLAEHATWQRSLDEAGETVAAWLARAAGRRWQRVTFVGCGTSCYAGQVARYVLEHVAHLPAEAVQAFAFARYTEPTLLGPDVLVAGISTTGESEAVTDALRRAREAGAATLAITANAGSSAARTAEHTILTGGAADRVLVKTASYVQSLVAIYLLAAALSGGDDQEPYWRRQIARAEDGARRFLDEQQPAVERLAAAYAQAGQVFILASGPNAGTAEEAALKVIEMAKMYCEAQELEDFLHGRLREVDQASPLIFIAPEGRSSARVLDFLTITAHIHAPGIVLTDQASPGMRELATHVLPLAELDEFATPLLYILPLHLLAYHLAVRRGWDPLSRRYEDFVPQKVRYGQPLPRPE